MAPTIEGQAEINGLLVGPATPYDLIVFNPWRRQTRADQTGPRAWNHGSWSGAEWREQVIVDIQLHYGASSTAGWKQLHDAASGAFAAVGDTANDIELRFLRGGTEYLMFGRPRTFDPEIRRGAIRAFASATFVATDPLIYSGALHSSGAIALPSFVGGLTVPLTVPFTIDATRVGGGTGLTNAGTAPTGLFIRIDGPVIEPWVALQRPDGTVQTLTFSLTVPTGQWLEIDTAARSVFINGLPTASVRGSTTAEPDWPSLPPGTSTLRFDASERNELASITVTHRDAWF